MKKYTVALISAFAMMGSLFAKEVEIKNKVRINGEKLPIEVKVYKKTDNGPKVCETFTVKHGRDKDTEYDCAGIEEGFRKTFTSGGDCCDAQELDKVVIYLNMDNKKKQLTIPSEKMGDHKKFIIMWDEDKGKLMYSQTSD